jgi:hypothetical protein
MPLKAGKSQATVSKNIQEIHKGPRYEKIKRKHGKETADKAAIAAAMQKRRESMSQVSSKGRGVTLRRLI